MLQDKRASKAGSTTLNYNYNNTYPPSGPSQQKKKSFSFFNILKKKKSADGVDASSKERLEIKIPSDDDSFASSMDSANPLVSSTASSKRSDIRVPNMFFPSERQNYRYDASVCVAKNREPNELPAAEETFSESDAPSLTRHVSLVDVTKKVEIPTFPQSRKSKKYSTCSTDHNQRCNSVCDKSQPLIEHTDHNNYCMMGTWPLPKRLSSSYTNNAVSTASFNSNSPHQQYQQQQQPTNESGYSNYSSNYANYNVLSPQTPSELSSFRNNFLGNLTEDDMVRINTMTDATESDIEEESVFSEDCFTPEIPSIINQQAKLEGKKGGLMDSCDFDCNNFDNVDIVNTHTNICVSESMQCLYNKKEWREKPAKSYITTLQLQ